MTEWNVSVELPTEFKSVESVFNNKEYINEWVDTLPVAAVSETSRLLYHAYQDLALHPINPATRFHFMERSTQVFFGMLRGLERNVYRGGFPLNQTNSQIAQRLLGMLALQVINYRLIIQELSESLLAGGLKRRHIYQHSLLRIVELLGEMFELYRHMDIPVSAGLWSVYNRYFSLVEADRLLNTSLTGMDGQTQTTIASEFKLQNLLAGLNPHDFRHNEYHCLKLAIRILGRGLELSPNGNIDNPSHFWLRLDEDAPISFIEPERALQYEESPFRRCLDISKLVHKLEIFIKENTDQLDLGQCQLSRHAARIMLGGWQVLADNHALRQSTSQPIEIVHGLSNIALVIMQENLDKDGITSSLNDAPPFDQELVIYGEAPQFGNFHAEVEGINIKQHVEKIHDDADLWNASYINIVQPSANWVENFRKGTGSTTTMKALLIDESPSGMGIAFDTVYQQHQFQIGDLLSVKLADSWYLLSIRWIRHHEDSMRMGLRRLGKNIRTQTLVVSRKGKPSQPMPMLHIEHQHGAPAVVLHNINIHPHDALIFSEAGTSVQIQVGELLDTSAVFECYQLDRSSMQ